jgi:hypothetical protein
LDSYPPPYQTDFQTRPFRSIRFVLLKCWFSLDQRARAFMANRLDNVSCIVGHLNLRGSVATALPCVTQRRFASAFAAVNRTNAFGLENFPAALLLPARMA